MPFDEPTGASSFAESMTSGAMWLRLEQLCQQSPRMKALRWMLDREGQISWLHTLGVLEDDQLMSMVPPFPPYWLRAISSHPELAGFLLSGAGDAQLMMELYREHASPPVDSPAILDFGCGAGRLLRFVLLSSARGELHGCDVNPAFVHWCQASLIGAQSRLISGDPPTSYASGTFDLIYALSVFTHLPEPRAKAWMTELTRLLSPGGVLVMTTHGPEALEVARANDEIRELLLLQPEDIARTQRALGTTGVIFRPYPKDLIERAQVGAAYGITLVHPDHLRAHWRVRGLTLAAYVPGGKPRWQDVVVWRRRPARKTVSRPLTRV